MCNFQKKVCRGVGMIKILTGFSSVLVIFLLTEPSVSQILQFCVVFKLLCDIDVC